MQGNHIDVNLTIGSTVFTFSTTKISEAYDALMDILGVYSVPFTPDDLMERLVEMRRGKQTKFECAKFSVILMDGEV